MYKCFPWVCTIATFRRVATPHDDWYVSNISIILDCSMLLYYHYWMFYNHFISFFGTNLLTQCPVPVAVFACFLHRRKSIPNGVQIQRNSIVIFYGLEDTHWARAAPGGFPEGGTTHQGTPGGPGAPKWVFAHLGASPRCCSRRAQVGCAHLGGLPHPLFAL